MEKLADNTQNGEAIKKNGKVDAIANKLKENIRILFTQLKFGCFRKFCYNAYCAKGQTVKFSGGDKEIISEAIKLAKLNNSEQFFCRDYRVREQVNENTILLMSDVETFALEFDRDPDYLKNNFERQNLLGINTDFNKLKKYYEVNKGNDIAMELINFNKYFSAMLDSSEFEVNNDRLNYYLFYLYSRILIYLSLNPNFCFQENLTTEFKIFFDNFHMLKSKIKKIEGKNHLNPYEEFKENINEYNAIINHYQNFLALLLFQIGDGEEELRDDKSFDVLVSFMAVFKTFYQINEKFHLISYKDFYNDSVSKYLNLKEECKTYHRILTKSSQDKEKTFCLIKYHWLFDASAKSDILYIFNYHKQRTEMMNSISDIMNFHSNQMDIRGMFLFMEIRRNNLIEDTLNFISNSQLNFRKPLKIKFVGEQGVDEGGVKKEFFLLLVRQLFDPDYGMFTYSDKNRFFWFNSSSFEPKIKFELIGVILGLAFFNNVILDIKFPLVIYKKILGLETTIEDMREIDQELYNNLRFLLNTKETNLKESLMTTFTVIVDQFGEKSSVPLLENGENIFIDETNKDEYVKLYLDWYFNKSIEHLFIPFRNGFYRVCENKMFHMLRPEELELIICGTQILNFKELEKATRYDDGYEKDSVTIKYFWEVIHSLTFEEQKKFLFFLTGCDRAPINGLGSLIITISRFGPDSDKLPCSHTCFNHLLLPDYQNKEKLRGRLVIAIGNSEGFGLI